jgi:hypothetical protein
MKGICKTHQLYQKTKPENDGIEEGKEVQAKV